jgi:Fic-DOC domain mobile mystery protein B
MAGLRQTWITNRRELDEAEQANIVSGTIWARRTRQLDLLSEPFVMALHRQMFGNVWEWAGTLRKRETNIGIEPRHIPVSLRELLDTARFWLGAETFQPQELAVHLHHRLVQIHPFPNGNGRHTRLMADLLVARLGATPLSWGRRSLAIEGETRATYIAALKAADNHDIGPLLAFARS